MTSLCHLLKGNCFNQWQNFAKRLCHPHWYNFILDTLRMVFVQCKFTKCIQPITPGSWQISISRFIDKLIFLCLCIASAWINYRYWTIKWIIMFFVLALVTLCFGIQASLIWVSFKSARTPLIQRRNKTLSFLAILK